MVRTVNSKNDQRSGGTQIRFADLFCGLGGFRLAAQSAASDAGLAAQCVFSCDIDAACRTAYHGCFEEWPQGDIAAVPAANVPDLDLLLAGFPCQPFSIIGRRQGFEDTRGTLFFEIARILEAKRPKAFVLENVKMLKGHDGGRTLDRILETVRGLGYRCEFRVLNALDYGLPQKRERIFIVGFRSGGNFVWPEGRMKMKPLADILEKNVPRRHYVSDHIRRRRHAAPHAALPSPAIWHENKSGRIGVHPFSCALRAGASYNYLLVDGERRLTPREMLRLQGFPDSYPILCSDSQTRRQAGNSLPIPVARAVLRQLMDACFRQA